MENIPPIRRKEISTYKPTDLWTEEDDFLFTNTAHLAVIGAGMLLAVTQGADRMRC
jgi:hypothetical protein